MNEQIKLLEKQCWSHHVDGTLVDGQLHFDTQKFAELIVRECMNQVDEFNRLIKAYQAQGIDPEIDITKEVLKNFGVDK